jgi:tetratricopeptide (TPR) repeat protein
LYELDAAGVQSLVEAGLRGPASPLLLSLVQNRAQGNPFFVEELVDALYEAGMLVHHEESVWTLAPATLRKLHEAHCIEYNRDGAMVIVPHAPLTDVLDLPDSVYSMVLARIDRLPELHRLTLKAASVIGQLFELDLLAHMYPLPLEPETLVEHLQALEQRDFMRSESPAPHATFAFRHNITQEVAYNTMLVEQRRSLHQAVGVVLEEFQPEAVERLAYHYSRSEVRDKMLHYVDKAARKSRYEYANETALQYYDQALQYEERWQWYYGRAAAYHVLGRREEEERALQALDAAVGVPQFAAGVLWGQYYEAVSDYEQAEAAFKRALADYRQRENQAGAARCLTQLGVVARRRGDYSSAGRWLEQAFALLEGEQAETVEGGQVFAQALNEMGMLHVSQSRYDKARNCFAQALEFSRAHSNTEAEAHALSNLGIVADVQRDFVHAITYYDQSLALRQAIGDRAGEGDSLYNTAIVVRQAGDYHSAQQYLRAVLDIYQAVSNRWGGVNAWNESGILYHELGKYNEAQSCLQHALELSREIGDEAGEAYILANLGLVALDAGKPEEAEPALQAGLNLAQAQYDQWLSAIIFHYLSVNNLYLGNHRVTLNYARTALNLRRELDLRPNEADDLAVMAVAHLYATEYEYALDQAKHALAILDECQGEGPEFPQRDYFFCYQVFAANQDVASARHALQAAHQMVMNRAEKITDPALRHSFLENVPINREIVAAMREG